MQYSITLLLTFSVFLIDVVKQSTSLGLGTLKSNDFVMYWYFKFFILLLQLSIRIYNKQINSKFAHLYDLVTAGGETFLTHSFSFSLYISLTTRE